jgi:hypothetical protein
MTISSNFVQFNNFDISLLQLSNFFGKISDCFKLWEFRSQNTKAKWQKVKSKLRIYLVSCHSKTVANFIKGIEWIFFKFLTNIKKVAKVSNKR